MTSKRPRKGTIPRAPKAPPPVAKSNRAATPTELWYLACLAKLSAFYGREPKITELARYCSRTVFPTFDAMERLEGLGLVERVPCDDGRNRFKPTDKGRAILEASA